MAYRILTTAAVLVALAAPAFADTTISTDCYGRRSRASGSWRTCNTEIKRDPLPAPRPIIIAAPEPYQPPRAETIYFHMPPRSTEPTGPVDPKCMKLNACLKIH